MSLSNPKSPELNLPLAGDSNAEKLRALRALVVNCPELRELEKQLGPFNIFDVLKSAHNEIRHSNVLAWLLDPNGSHGMQELFLRRWLMRIFYDEQESASYLDPIKIDSAPFRSVEVRREWNHIDVLVEIETQSGEQWVICIENKIWSWRSAGKLSAYRDRVERAFPSAVHRAYIFLTVRAEQPDDDSYVVGRYEQVGSVLETCLVERGGSLGQGPRLLIQHYLSVLQERLMEDSKVIQLAQQIYAKHRLALDTIFEHRPDNLLFLTDELEQRVKADAASLALKHKYTGKGWIGFVPSIWEVAENIVNETWSTVLCEITLIPDRLILKALLTRTHRLIGGRNCTSSPNSILSQIRAKKRRSQAGSLHFTGSRAEN
jgi:hypothetical protein